MKATFNLQEGFKDDKVLVFNSDKKIYQADDVTTRTQIGLAGSFEAEFTEKDPLIKIEIPTRGIESEKRIEAEGNVHVGISVSRNGREIVWKISDRPFMYM